MRYIKFLIALLLISSCNKDERTIPCSAKTNQMDDVKKLIVGTYNWAYSKVTIQTGSTIQTPSSTGVSYKYVFKSSGLVDYFENDTLKWNNPYIVDYEFKVSNYPLDSATVIIINNKQTAQRLQFFRPYLCNDSAKFYNPY